MLVGQEMTKFDFSQSRPGGLQEAQSGDKQMSVKTRLELKQLDFSTSEIHPKMESTLKKNRIPVRTGTDKATLNQKSRYPFRPKNHWLCRDCVFCPR